LGIEKKITFASVSDCVQQKLNIKRVLWARNTLKNAFAVAIPPRHRLGSLQSFPKPKTQLDFMGLDFMGLLHSVAKKAEKTME